DGNTLIINKLHSNLRYVAKFIEVYTEYIFAEPADASGIEVKAVYYTTSELEKIERDGDFPIIRTDREGHNLTGENHPDYNSHGIDSKVTAIDQDFFNLYEQDDARTVVPMAAKTGNLTPLIMRDRVRNPNTGKVFTKYTSESYTNYVKLLNGDFGSGNEHKYLVNAEDDELLRGELSLRNMYFDVHTSVFIVVGVKSDAELTVHSLGFSPSYVIEPIIEPTEEFINHNQSAEADEKYDYLYYVFKVTYDRNPQNDLAAYEVHATRFSSIAGDVLAGNYSEFYKNHFNIYDNYGNLINYTLQGGTTNTGRQVNLSSYLTTLKNKNIISTEIWAEFRNQYFDNVRDCLEAVSRAARKPGLVYVDHAIAINGEVDEDGNPIILKSAEDIFMAVKNLKVVDEDDPTKMVYYFKTPRLIKRGMQNTVNLSSIPIYSYTIQAITVDDYTYDASGKLVFTEPEEPEEPEDGEEPEDPEEPQLVLNNSKKHFLKNTIYTAAGTNKYTYLGYGDLFKLPDPVIYVDNKYSENVELHFTDSYINLEYGEENEDKSILSDLPIAENTNVLLDGADAAQEGYAFVGWFEQKYNKKSNVCLQRDVYNCECAPDQECTCEDHECEYGTEGWSELTLMSKDVDRPYLTLATADTVIVAVYKKEDTFTRL
ncbi:MAG: hypothetical protein IJB98_02990, partial [Clostridia bacterium]|nr:hypothetical protein [Clostridia bacterium]